MTITKEQLSLDLAAGGDESYQECAFRLYDLGYRMPDCPERWQHDRLFGGLVGAARQTKTLDAMAEVLVDVARWERVEPS